MFRPITAIFRLSTYSRKYTMWCHECYGRDNVLHEDGDIVRCDNVRCDIVRCDIVRCDIVRCDIVRCDIVRCDTVRCDTVRCDIVRCDIVRCDIVRCDIVRCDIVRCNIVRCDIVRCDITHFNVHYEYIFQYPHFDVRRDIVHNFFFFAFCWPCISIYSFKENQLNA